MPNISSYLFKVQDSKYIDLDLFNLYSYDVHDALERALTFGIEHTYESILESNYATCEYAYDYLTNNIDYLFDTQKHKALKKFWDFGLKIEPKVNPG